MCPCDWSSDVCSSDLFTLTQGLGTVIHQFDNTMIIGIIRMPRSRPSHPLQSPSPPLDLQFVSLSLLLLVLILPLLIVLSNWCMTVPRPWVRVKFREQHSVLSHAFPKLSEQQHHRESPQNSMVYEGWMGTSTMLATWSLCILWSDEPVYLE